MDNSAPQLKVLSPKQQLFVSLYLSDSGRNATRAAEGAGYKHPRIQGARLLSNVDIQSHINAWRLDVKKLAITSMESRLEVLERLKLKLLQVIEDRAEAYSSETAPGASTGLLVKQEKVIGSGDMARDIDEWTYDAAITKDILALDAQAAKELGQWTERVDHSGSLKREIVVIFGDEDDS